MKGELAKFYDMLLTFPGMNEAVKIDLRLSRKSILILSRVIARGIRIQSEDKDGAGILEIVSPDSLEELSGVADELLQKAGLAETNEKLKAFSQ
ncbi:MAG: hypothetical protein EOO61_15495 [Hymenobacter sp.]|nr:MAG: hypothetical protein EOO61_15495 [Hymenobacter sp.]